MHMQSLTLIEGVPPVEEMQRWSACGAAADEERQGAVGVVLCVCECCVSLQPHWQMALNQ